MRPHASLRANIAWNLGCIIWLLSVGFADAQDLIPDSGSFRTHPLVAAVGDSVRLEFRADYPFSNASLALSAFSVEPELVTIDLNAVWHEGSNSPADATTTQQSVEIPLGPLDEGVYDVLVRVDGAQFFFSYF